MKKLALLFSLILILGLGSCTENQKAKAFGGTMKIVLPEGKKLVEATWKNEDLWYLTRDMREGEVPETYQFQENSSFGVWEGTVTFIEKE